MKKKLLKPLSFLPALFMLALIFGFSAQNGETSGNLSNQISYKIVQIGDGLLGTHLSETELDSYAEKIEFPGRGPSVRDVLIDSTGAALALICLYLLRHRILFNQEKSLL